MDLGVVARKQVGCRTGQDHNGRQDDPRNGNHGEVATELCPDDIGVDIDKEHHCHPEEHQQDERDNPVVARHRGIGIHTHPFGSQPLDYTLAMGMWYNRR